MKIIGVSGFYHDSAAALVVDGEIIAAAQEERFTRKKHDPSFPQNAIEYCLAEGGSSLADIDHVVFYEKPFIKFERLLETYLAFSPRGFKSFSRAMPVWLKEKLFQKNVIIDELKKIDKNFFAEKLMFSEHHLSHAASAFYPSPFEEAVVLTLDGVGEWGTTTVAIGKGEDLSIVKALHFPHSLGLLYSAFTYYTGFKVNSGEYKLMGLAPYGDPQYKDLILEYLLDLKEDGSYSLDMNYFDYCTGLTMVNKNFETLFGHAVRNPGVEKINQFHMDIAASIQVVTEEVVLRMVNSLAKEYKIENLCMAGGVALNCVANGKILRDGAFKGFWVQPAAGDAGGALGAALAVCHKELRQPRKVLSGDSMQGSYLGPSYTQGEIEAQLTSAKAVFKTLSEGEMVNLACDSLQDEKAVGWFQGRAEFGPRALGGRSIIGDPRSKKMQKMLNLKVKYRESFRPFAPSVLREDASDWFDLDSDSPYMLIVANVQDKICREMTEAEQKLFGIEKLNIVRSSIPAVTHVDYSARVQTVNKETNSRYHRLISRFKELTGCPIVINTSFNVRGEPIVQTPEDAFHCFMGTDIELLICGCSVMWKEDQDPALLEDYKNKYELD
jgi:carbamoyltransferase